MGEIDTVSLGDIAEITAGQSPPGFTINRSGDGVPFFQGAKDFGARYPQVRTYTTAPARLASPGDILLSVRAPIGRVNRCQAKCAIGRGVSALRSRSEIALTDYLEYWLRAYEPRWYQHESAGSVFSNLSTTELLHLELPLPPLSEQRAIAEVLGALDDKIEANQRQVQCLLNLIGADWHLRFYESRDQWPQLPIGEVCTAVGGSTPRTTVQEYWDGNIAWATPKDLSRLSSPSLFDTERRITELGLRQISSGLLPRGTVLLSSRAPIGYLAIAELPVAVNQGVIALVPSERLPGLYLWQWLSHNLHEVMTRANGTTFLEVSKTNIRSMPIAVPPEKDLEGWVEIAEPMYRLLFAREIENKELVEVRDTLLPKLLSGELRVRDAEPLVEEVV